MPPTNSSAPDDGKKYFECDNLLFNLWYDLVEGDLKQAADEDAQLWAMRTNVDSLLDDVRELDEKADKATMTEDLKEKMKDLADFVNTTMTRETLPRDNKDQMLIAFSHFHPKLTAKIAAIKKVFEDNPPPEATSAAKRLGLRFSGCHSLLNAMALAGEL
ncbi:hypothetical protein QBC45DRAFT_395297 [Copromyces sp. CBS 386.78]|nr:hypothetical protein QBC45DRAFT_395297 [Copromyces sp. CBS 386.78]